MLRQDKPKRQIALNIQTTGYEAAYGDRITEIAALEYIDGKYTGNYFSSLINPEGREIAPGAVECNKITEELVSDAPLFTDIADEFLAFIRNDEVILQNAVYTTTFINTEMQIRREKASERIAELEKAKTKLENDLDDAAFELSFADKDKTSELSERMVNLEKELSRHDDLIDHYHEIANTEWLDFCVDRDVRDVMEKDQKLFPRREGYSHKLDAICERFNIKTNIEHNAENRAKLAMQAYQKLCEVEKKREQAMQQQAHTMFGQSNARKASNTRSIAQAPASTNKAARR